jgi:hypothetical protein
MLGALRFNLAQPHRSAHTNCTGIRAPASPPFTDYRYGDRTRAEAKLQTPTDMGDFSYRDYLARQGVYSTPHLRFGAGVRSRPPLSVPARDQGFAPFGWLALFTARNISRQKSQYPLTDRRNRGKVQL